MVRAAFRLERGGESTPLERREDAIYELMSCNEERDVGRTEVVVGGVEVKFMLGYNSPCIHSFFKSMEGDAVGGTINPRP